MAPVDQRKMPCGTGDLECTKMSENQKISLGSGIVGFMRAKTLIVECNALEDLGLGETGSGKGTKLATTGGPSVIPGVKGPNGRPVFFVGTVYESIPKDQRV